MISKELLSEVLKYPMEVTTNVTYYISIISEPYFLDGNKTAVYFNTDNVGLGVCKINIYELAHKCKEWAFNKGGIDITSGKRLGLDGWECLVFVGVIPCDCYEAETEPQAIFKACQWILENK